MFTGIVKAQGRLRSREEKEAGQRLCVRRGENGDLGEIGLGDSVAVNGVCLSVADKGEDMFFFDLGSETLRRTTLGSLPLGAPLNLEPALTLRTPLGGHLVTGHVDGLGTVLKSEKEGEGARLWALAPTELTPYICPRGSICLDGVGLTVVTVEKNVFSVNLIPHTLCHTSLSTLRPEAPFNLEVDIIARYLERLLIKNKG